ncbi:BTAD domain-containing putative transcriptional regulator [Streptomyces sp. NPDC060333]|uniref:AfsR/SARP family transcriptional regulator n=1 Tax=Streptomyces sp. NPDC060333 TaxID=3347098 RepID=UPI0036596AC2
MPYDTSLPTPALRLLGTFRFEVAGGAVAVEAPGQRLLAFLALNRSVSRGVLAGTLWPEAGEVHAQGSLRTALWRLRRGGQHVVDSRGEMLSLGEEVTVDAHAFLRTALRVVDADGDAGDDPCLGLLFAGDLLPGWDDEWTLFERERLRQLRLHALESLSARLTRSGRHALALDAALTCVSIEPLRESAHRAVVAVHLAEHNAVEAVRQYGAFRRLVRAELGLEPSARFTAMLPPGAAGGW